MPRGRAGLRFLALLGMALAACQAPTIIVATPPPNTPTPIIHGTLPISTMGPASTFDRQFLDLLVPHREASVEMAAIALARSQRPELRAVAEDMQRTLTQQIEDMRAWREVWFGSRATPAINQAPILLEPGAPVASAAVLTLDFSSDVEALRSAPEPFEAAFIATVARHEQRAVEAASLAIRRARQQEILDLSGAILADHQRWRRQLDDLR